MTTVRLDDVLAVLKEHGHLQGVSPLPPAGKPGHCAACSCADCHWTYEDCVCRHSALLRDLQALDDMTCANMQNYGRCS